MKLKKYLIFFSILFSLSLFFILNNVVSGQIYKNSRIKNEEIVKELDDRFFQKSTEYGNYWVSLPEKISSNKITPIVILLHGGVFNGADHGYIFTRIFRSVYKDYNIVVASPKMPVNSYPVWRQKDKKLIKSVIENVKKEYRLNPESPVFFGGFSNGAEYALKLVLTKEVKANGVFAFAGGCRLVWNKINKSVNRNLPIFLSAGYKDGNWIGSTLASYRHLKLKKFSNVTIAGFPGVEHWIDIKQVYKLLEWIKENKNNV